MTPETIGFLDSGIGGLPYLAHLRKSLGGGRFVYAADRVNFPYGEKRREEIISATLGVAERLVARENPRLIVVACNTMSVMALDSLRARFPLPFVGVVPAVKPAAELSRRRCVGVLATRQTVEGDYLRELIERHAAGCVVVSLSSAGLVEFVEKELSGASEEERRERVRQEVARFRAAGIDALVLGCTHFLHLEQEFRLLLQAEGISLVDSRDGVSHQVARLLPTGAGPRDGADDAMYLTGPMPLEDRYGWFARRFGLRLAGAL
jgi:glutamate racemase